MRFEQLRPLRRLLPLVMLVGLLASWLPAPVPTQAQGASGWSAVIHGTVRDAATQAGIAGARVEVRDITLTTGADGAIPETTIPLSAATEEVAVTVTADGYGIWRYRGVELKAAHRLELRIELRDQPTIVEPQAVSASAAPYDGPPDYIRVGRTFHVDCQSQVFPPPVVRVDRLPFIDYVKNVLPNEWLRSWPDASLEAGAVAVAQYAWKTAFVDRKWTRFGFPYDIVDSTCDQHYKDRDPTLDYSRTDAAVERVWGTALLRTTTSPPTFFTTFYRAWQHQCKDRSGNQLVDCIGQWETYYAARNNQAWSGLQILSALYGAWGTVGYIETAPLDRALALYRSPDVTIAPGESATLSACLHNAGKVAWQAGATGLAVINPNDSSDPDYRSPLAHESWPSPQLAARLDSDAPLGAKVMLRFAIAAPADLAPGTYRLALQPAQAGTPIPVDRPLTWNVQVVAPSEQVGGADLEPRVWLPLIVTGSEQIPAGCE